MELHDYLLEMEETMSHLSDGLNAIHLMALGLEEAGDTFAGGLYMVWSYLSRKEQALKQSLEACLEVL